MILSRGRKYIFLHAPKTGGTALALALEARAMAEDVMAGDTPKARKRRRKLASVKSVGRLWKHSKLADLEGLITREEAVAFFVFTLVRNPWDRLVSYYHWLRVQRFDHPAVGLAQRLDFAAFLAAKPIQAGFRAESYTDFVRDGAGRDCGDLFIRLEHLAEDIAPLEAHLGFRLGPIARVNASDRRADYRGYYTDKTAAIVADICAEDIARFGYGFDRQKS
ncbi:MAG: Type II secretory pathway, pullulanase PulA [Rhodobacterales bacterium]|nr:MAG: Type II secretory pathway, pullulanase PulA [Rhodobacterales bacterium]